MAQNNVIGDETPQRFAPAAPDERVNQAVQAYIEGWQAAGPVQPAPVPPQPPLARRFRSVLGRGKRKLLGQTASTPAKPRPEDYTTLEAKGDIVPVQAEAYFLVLNRFVEDKSSVLDVGFGLGYGMIILSIKAGRVHGIEVDPKALKHGQETQLGRNPRLASLSLFDGMNVPFEDGAFDIVTCVDVLEHVEDYDRFLREVLRVARKGVFISTPNRRSEYTNFDGTPKNYWHRREWRLEELKPIVERHGKVEWHFINGPFEGPFKVSEKVEPDTLALTPFITRKP
jgi:SAM-dependent methyltransferase